jgi:hypothetical protein
VDGTSFLIHADDMKMKLHGKPGVAHKVDVNHKMRTEAVSKLFAYLFFLCQLFFIYAYSKIKSVCVYGSYVLFYIICICIFVVKNPSFPQINVKAKIIQFVSYQPPSLYISTRG